MPSAGPQTRTRAAPGAGPRSNHNHSGATHNGGESGHAAQPAAALLLLRAELSLQPVAAVGPVAATSAGPVVRYNLHFLQRQSHVQRAPMLAFHVGPGCVCVRWLAEHCARRANTRRPNLDSIPECSCQRQHYPSDHGD